MISLFGSCKLAVLLPLTELKYSNSVLAKSNCTELLALSLYNFSTSLSSILIFLLRLVEATTKAISSIYEYTLVVKVGKRSRIYIRNSIGDIGLP